MIELLFILISVLLVIACGIFVAAEFAFVTVDRNRIDRLTEKGDPRAAGVQSALRSLSTQLSGAQIGITITNLLIGFLAEPALAEVLRGPLETIGVTGAAVSAVAIVVAITVATLLTMLFGELVPKNLAIAKPVETARFVQGPQRFFTYAMHYPIAFMNGTANWTIRRFNIEPREELASARSSEELLSVVKHSARRGTLAQDTAILVERSLEFSERHGSDVMTPRVKLQVVSATDPASAVIQSVKRTGYSRFPVIKDSIDNIVGIVHIKQAVAVPFDQRDVVAIKSIMQPVTFVPSSIELDTLIEKMRNEKTEAVITIDEFGGIDGLVTLEDLIEELVGEVKDEHDEAGIAIAHIRKDVWSVSGLLRPDEIGSVTGLVIPEDEEFETIGGLVLDQLEKVPKVGDQVVVDGLNRAGEKRTIRLRVTGMDGRRIDRLELVVLESKENQ